MRIIKKRGISPVVATVLLIAIVIVIGLIIFLWFKTFLQDIITKDIGTGEKNVDLVCDDVEFDASYSDSGVLSVSNVGNVPIYEMNIKFSKAGEHSTKNIRDLPVGSWPKNGINPGGVFSEDIISEISGVTEITLIPVLLGSAAEGGKKTFVCDEARHGYPIRI